PRRHPPTRSGNHPGHPGDRHPCGTSLRAAVDETTRGGFHRAGIILSVQHERRSRRTDRRSRIRSVDLQPLATMRWSISVLYAAMTVFLASAAAILISLENGSRALAIAGGFGNVVAGVLFVLSVWLPRRRIDWDRIEAEQRLWE